MPAGLLERTRSAPAPEPQTQPQVDTIALPQRDILLLGAGSGWGRDLAVRLADRGK